MIDRKTTMELGNQMRHRRREILDLRDSFGSSRRDLQEPENELEESAGKGTILESVDRMDDRVVDEIRKIDAALARLENGTYGRCDVCGRPIAVKRLQALPWAATCRHCAQNLEMQPTRNLDMVQEEEEVEPERSDMTDARIVESIWDELDSKEHLDLGTLQIQSNSGTIYLTGKVMTENDHQQVLEAIQEDMGYEDVIDRIDIEELERQRFDSDGELDYERETEGEPAGEDMYAARDEDESVVPPDEMLPEDDRYR